MMIQSKRSAAFKDIGKQLIESVEEVRLVYRYRDQLTSPETSEEFDRSVLIDLSEINYSEGFGNSIEGVVSMSFYVCCEVYGYDVIKRNLDGKVEEFENIDKVLEDFDFLEAVRDSLDGMSGDGFKNINIIRESEFLRSDNFIVFLIEAEARICRRSETC
jgi:hypothetical protein